MTKKLTLCQYVLNQQSEKIEKNKHLEVSFCFFGYFCILISILS